VVIPAYNRADLIARTLRSVAAQRPRRPVETIVVDDHSSDDTGRLATQMGACVVRHDRNRGAAAARNSGWRAATQPWIALLDSDDEWLPDHLDTLWSLRGDHVLVAGSALGIGPDGVRRRFHGPVSRQPVILSSPAELIYPTNFVPASAVLVRRDVLERVGGYNTERRISEDFDLWLRVLEHGTGIGSPRVIAIYHRHEGQKTHDARRARAAQPALLAPYADRPWWSQTLLERRVGVNDWDDIEVAVRKGDFREALSLAWRILSHYQRARGVIGMWAWRFLIRRRSSVLGADGGPSIAVVGGEAERERVSRALPHRNGSAVVCSGRWPSMMLRLLRRPTGIVVVRTPAQAALARVIGVRPVRRDDLDTSETSGLAA
jgi:glycosyltransferase involved in cell wall biosynthesis